MDVVPPSNGATGIGSSHGDVPDSTESNPPLVPRPSPQQQSTRSSRIPTRSYTGTLQTICGYEGEMWNNCNYYYYCHTHFLLLYNHDACMIKTVKILILHSPAVSVMKSSIATAVTSVPNESNTAVSVNL